MRKLNSALLLNFAIILFACNSNKSKRSEGILNSSYLRKQEFTINTSRDTTLLTGSGVIIKIPMGSIAAASGTVKLEIKEALAIKDMLLAGLTTQSNGQALGSGGMIYLNAAEGQDAKIIKPLQTMIPTATYDAEMKVFKGEGSEPNINWTDPKPLPKDSIQADIRLGKALFNSNCSNCHKASVDFTGPHLRNVHKTRSRQWVYDFIHNPAKMIVTDRKAKALFKMYAPTVMTAFPQFKKRDIDAILAYVSTVREPENPARSVQPLAKDSTSLIPAYFDPCMDSCEIYLNLLNYQLSDTDEFFNLNRTYPLIPSLAEIPGERTTETEGQTLNTDNVIINNSGIEGTFYTIEISGFGWCNIDRLLKEFTTPSRLLASMDKDYGEDITVRLIIPSVKSIIDYNNALNGKTFDFGGEDGTLPLPQNEKCYVVAYTEIDGKLLFGKKEFISGMTQTINISLTTSTKEKMAAEIKSLNLDVAEPVNDTSPPEDKLAKPFPDSLDGMKLKPKNCDCGPSSAAPIASNAR